MTKTMMHPRHERDGLAITLGNGISVETPSFSVSLDPKRASRCDYTFVSHAHIDHVHLPNGKSKVVASKETAKLAKLRGYDLGQTREEAPGIDLLDAGHILGSRSVLVKDRLLYTGDLSTRDRAFLKGFKGVKCETLIIESTYGRNRYVFPETEDLVSEVNRFISYCFDNCRPVILTGYPLGKAQLISYLFNHWEPIYVNESIHAMNSCHIDLGVGLKCFDKFNSSEKLRERSSSGPWILISPSSGSRSPFLRSLREKYNAALATFSGWAVDSRYRFMMNVDRAFPMSDHCDYQELIDFVRRCAPSKVYTVHGFAAEFAAKLQSLGFDAEPLENEADPQRRLTSFAA